MERKELVSMVESGVGYVGIIWHAAIINENMYGNIWIELAGLFASGYALADGLVRAASCDKSGSERGTGLSERLFRQPVRAGKYLHRRYRSWREIREIDAQAKKGEVYV